jgi:hypothetical protein
MNLDKKDKSKTLLGGFLTLFIFILFMAGTWILGNDIIFKRKPFTSNSSIISKDYPVVKIDSESFPIAIFPSDLYGRFEFDERYVQLDVSHVIYATKNSTKYVKQRTQLDLEKCSQNNFSKLSEKDFSDSIIVNAFCIKKQNETLQGYWTANEGEGLTIKLKMCDKSIDSNCADEDEIKQYIARTQFALGIIYLDTLIDFSNYYDPFQYSSSIIYKFANSDLSKIVNLMVYQGTLKTDSGFFTSNIHERKYIFIDENQNDSASFNKQNGILISMNFYGSNASLIHLRKYAKLSDILASIGGVLNICIIIFYYLNLLFSRQNKYLTTINKAFMIKDKFKKNNLNEGISSFIKFNFLNTNKIEVLNNKNMFKEENKIESIYNKFNHKNIKNEITKDNNHFSLNFKDSLKLAFNCCI